MTSQFWSESRENRIAELEHENRILRQRIAQLQQGGEYLKSVALAAFKRLPPEALEEMETDIEFFHITTQEEEG